MNTQEVIAYINEKVFENTGGGITGNNLNQVLKEIVNNTDYKRQGEGDEQNLLIGTEAERLAITDPREGLLFHQVEPSTNGYTITKWMYDNGLWVLQLADDQLANKVIRVCGYSNIPVFNTSTNYLVNDLVLYNNLFWRCTENHDSAPWNPAHFVQSTLYNEIMAMRGADVENVLISLSTEDGEGDLSGLEIGVILQSTGRTSYYTTDDRGECVFQVTKGDYYTIQFPSVGGYEDLQPQTFKAVTNARTIEAEYQVYGRTEHLTVQVQMDNGSGSIDHTDLTLVGYTVQVNVNNGEFLYQQALDGNLQAQFEIPIGKSYTVTMPDHTGYHPKRKYFTQVASRDFNVIIAKYFVDAVGIYGIDAEGNLYTEDEIAEIGTPLNIIVGVTLNTPALEAADRGDGTTGCGVIFPLPFRNGGTRLWANSNVEFDRNVLPFLDTDAKASADYKSAFNTEAIRSIGDSLGVDTPAADYCYDQTLTIDGEEKHGLLPAYGVWKQALNNLGSLQSLATACGTTFPNLRSGRWWSSCQSSVTNAVNLNNGGFLSDLKTGNYYQAACVFDLKSNI